MKNNTLRNSDELSRGFQSLRILVLAPQPFFQQRGTPIAVRLLVEGLAGLGHQIDLLVYHEGEELTISGVELHRAERPPFVRQVPIGPSWQKILCDVAMWFKLRRLLREKSFDLIHAVEESVFLAERGDVPFVYDMDSRMSRQIVEKSSLFWPIALIFAWLERRALRRSVGVLAVCESLVESARRHQSNVDLLPDVALDGHASGTLPKELSQATGLRFMYVGNLQRYQGVDLMLEAFANFSSTNSQAVLLIVGGDVESIRTYRKRAAALGVADRVKLLGTIPVECLGRVLCFADILISPRIKGENTPMKLYGYLLSGKPVLATRLPTHTQVIGDAHAILVAPTVEAMADGMNRLASSAELRARIGMAGREFAKERYSPEAFRIRLQNFYRRLLAANFSVLENA